MPQASKTECQIHFFLQQLVPVGNSYQTPEYPITVDIQYKSRGGFNIIQWALITLLPHRDGEHCESCWAELQGSQTSRINWETGLTAAAGCRLPEIEVVTEVCNRNKMKKRRLQVPHPRGGVSMKGN